MEEASGALLCNGEGEWQKKQQMMVVERGLTLCLWVEKEPNRRNNTIREQWGERPNRGERDSRET
jgi:hypothetical protein